MSLEGIHHVTAITGDALGNVEFYTGPMGLRLVAKTVNQDDPTVYHLFFADEKGDAGSDITFFEYPGAAPGRAGEGMVHRVVWRVASPRAIDFWGQRLADHGVEAVRVGERILFTDPEGLGHELVVYDGPDEPLRAEHSEIPSEHALQGFDCVRIYAGRPDSSVTLLRDVMNAAPMADNEWELRGQRRGGTIVLDEPPAEAGVPGAGTVHHVAWGTTIEEHPKWLKRLQRAGVSSTQVIDRHYFHSIYFREPSGVLYEIADDGPGFTVDGPVEELGTKIILPPFLEARRAVIEQRLTPLPDPRAGRA